MAGYTPEEFTQEMSRIESAHKGDQEAINYEAVQVMKDVLRNTEYSAGVAILERAQDGSYG